MPASARKISANSAITISVPASSSVSAGNGAWKPASSRVCSRAVLISESRPPFRIRSAPTSTGSANSEVTRVLLIANPMAARTAHASVSAVANALRVGGWDVEVLATGGPGHARELAEYGVANGVNVVAVFGGDGTTMQAAAALVGTNIPLGVIPGGTGNLLAGNLRIPVSPARAARALLTAVPRPFDLGRMDRPGGSLSPAGRAPRTPPPRTPAIRPRPHGPSRRLALLCCCLRCGIRRAGHGRHSLRAQAALGHGCLLRNQPEINRGHQE